MALLYRSAIRNLPDGYTFRGATLHDAPEVAWLFHQRFMISDTDASSHAEKIRKEWQSFNFNPAMDVRLVLDQREHLIGYIEVWTVFSPPVQPWLWGCVHPDYEGRGIGTALLSWAEARVRLAMELLPSGQRFAPRFGAPRALAASAPLLSTILRPIELDPLTAADDADFLQQLLAQPNVPAALKLGLRDLF